MLSVQIQAGELVLVGDEIVFSGHFVFPGRARPPPSKSSNRLQGLPSGFRNSLLKSVLGKPPRGFQIRFNKTTTSTAGLAEPPTDQKTTLSQLLCGRPEKDGFTLYLSFKSPHTQSFLFLVGLLGFLHHRTV